MEWSGVEWSGVEWSGVEWSGVEWSGAARSGVVWSAVEWCGVEWSGVDWSCVFEDFVFDVGGGHRPGPRDPIFRDPRGAPGTTMFLIEFPLQIDRFRRRSPGECFWRSQVGGLKASCVNDVNGRNCTK